MLINVSQRYYKEIYSYFYQKKLKKSDQNQQINPSHTVEEFLDDEKDEEQLEAEETKAELNKKLLKEMKKNRKFSHSRLRNLSLKKQTSIQTADKKLEKCVEYDTPPFYMKIYLLWHSPYTKFWINLVKEIN